jgi:Putative Actinobacterial Holin-X, holin superfamily III
LPADDPTPKNIAQAITEVSEKASLLVREEIELAKAEISARITKLVKGAIVGLAAGIFIVTGLLFLLHGAAWFAWQMTGTRDSFWLGFLIVAVILFLLGALAGALAYKAMKAGSPPVPEMAIDEAKKIRETVSAHDAAPSARGVA